MNLLYFHGGPGFNSNPEKELLLDRFSREGLRLFLWNEPSSLRPGGPTFQAANAFQNYLDRAEEFFLAHSANEPVVVIGHSFGSHALVHLAALHAEKIRLAVAIDSDLALEQADMNMF